VTTWGASVLSLSTDYRVVIAQNFIAGTLNDTFNVYVNPTDLVNEGANTAYLTMPGRARMLKAARMLR